ncbi:MAG: DEAD/DEAH box helicase family protein [Deltaproteobacteria bacterium]|nr:DEAD/DEAH box helicase family protein [Deltaproteobacteria bacterium]
MRLSARWRDEHPVAAGDHPLLGCLPTQQPLYDYQSAGFASVMEAYRAGRDRGLVVIPTGGGKTRTFCAVVADFMIEQLLDRQLTKGIAETALQTMSPSLRNLPAFLAPWQRPPQILIIAHTDEIVQQIRKNMREVLDGVQMSEGLLGIVQRAHKQWNRLVVVASAQTICRSKEEFALHAHRYGTVIVDEAHHYVSDNEWFFPLQACRFFTADGIPQWNYPRFLLGVTATPDRGDGRHLSTVYGPDGLLYAIDLDTLIKKGRLLIPEGIAVRLHLEGPEPPTAQEAIRRASPDAIAEAIDRVARDVLWVPEEGRYRRTRFFVRSRDDIERTVTLLQSHGIQVEGLRHDLDPVERRRIIEGHRTGAVDITVSQRIGMEGDDNEALEAVGLFLSTDSRAFVVQMVGRALRVDKQHPERRRAWILDAGGNLVRHDLGIDISAWYDAAVANGGGTGGGALTRTPPSRNGAIRDISIEYTGPLCDLTLVESAELRAAFRQTMHALLPTPEDVQQVAFMHGMQGDQLFAYWNGLMIPQEWKELDELRSIVGDPRESLVEIWAMMRVAQMEYSHPLVADLPLPQQQLARRFRYGLFRWHRGLRESAYTESRVLECFETDGTLPLNNQPRQPLASVYAHIRRIATGGGVEDVEAVAHLCRQTIFSQRAWPEIGDREADGASVLQSWIRFVTAEVFGGDIPHAVVGQYSALRRFLADCSAVRPSLGEAATTFLLTHDPTIVCKFGTREAGSRSIAMLLMLAHVSPPRAREEIEKETEDRPVTVELSTWCDRHVAKQRGTVVGRSPVQQFFDWLAPRWIGVCRGTVPSQLAGKHVRREIRTTVAAFLEQGDVAVLRALSPEGLRIAGPLLLAIGAGDAAEARTDGRRLYEAVLYDVHGWGAPPMHYEDFDALLLWWARWTAITEYDGCVPTTGEGHLSYFLRQWLKNGASLDSVRSYESLRRFLGNGDPRRAANAETVLIAAIMRDRHWDQPTAGLSPVRQSLLTWMRQMRFRRNRCLKTPFGTIDRFLENGEIQQMNKGQGSVLDFWRNLIAECVGDDPALCAEAWRRIYAVIDDALGLDVALATMPEGMRPAVRAIFDIAMYTEAGVPTGSSANFPRGSALLKFLTHKGAWPVYRSGTHIDSVRQRFNDSVIALLVRHGMEHSHAETMVSAADTAAYV